MEVVSVEAAATPGSGGQTQGDKRVKPYKRVEYLCGSVTQISKETLVSPKGHDEAGL